MIKDILFMLSGAGMVLALIPAVLLLREGTVAARFLATSLIVAALNILHALAFSSADTSGILFEPTQFALPPLFAAYVRALFQHDWRPRLRDLLHFVPWASMSASAILLSRAGFQAPVTTIISLAAWGSLLIMALIYVGRALGRIKSYRVALKREMSTIRGIDPVWLLRYSIALHALYLGFLIIPAIVIHTGDLTAARYIISLLLCIAVGYLAVHQIFAARPIPIPLPPDTPVLTRPVTWDSTLPLALRIVMEERHLYRNPDLDLNLLAAELGWTRNEVSAAINGHFKCNFHDFVNGYRVEEAKLLLADPANAGLTLLALGLQAGFNSKPTFNAVFKKMTGQSPSDWQKSPQLPDKLV